MTIGVEVAQAYPTPIPTAWMGAEVPRRVHEKSRWVPHSLLWGGKRGSPEGCYNLGMAYKASAHAVDDLKYPIVWTPKYRRALLVGEVAQAVQDLFYQIAAAYEMEIDTMEVMEDHVHLFLSAPPRYAPARIVQILQSLSARELFARFPRLRHQMWGGQLWEDGYFVRSVGDAVTAELIRRSIRYQKSPQNVQLSLFDERP